MIYRIIVYLGFLFLFCWILYHFSFLIGLNGIGELFVLETADESFIEKEEETNIVILNYSYRVVDKQYEGHKIQISKTIYEKEYNKNDYSVIYNRTFPSISTICEVSEFEILNYKRTTYQFVILFLVLIFLHFLYLIAKKEERRLSGVITNKKITNGSIL